jgi:hypothetical protein
MRFPAFAHGSAAAHKLDSTPQQDRINLISGDDQTSSQRPAFIPPRKPSKQPGPSHFEWCRGFRELKLDPVVP